MGRRTSDKYVDDKNVVGESTFKDWFHEHKKAILIGTAIVLGPAVVIGAVAVAGVLVTANFPDSSISDSSSDDEDYDSNMVDFPEIKGCGSSKSPHPVNGFVRNLPEGWKASSAKMTEAEELGITLEKNQTYVDSYRTGTRY